MLSAKMDLLLCKLDGPEQSNALDARMTWEHCGSTGHSGKDCPSSKADEELYFVDTGFRPQGGYNQGWNNRPNLSIDKENNQRTGPSFKDIIANQTRINESISKKLLANNKILEAIDGKIEGFATALQNQLSHC